jgi:hypothetical protein
MPERHHLRARHAVDQARVDRNHREEKDDLPDGHQRFDEPGFELAHRRNRDPTLAQRLHQVVGAENQEDVREHRQRDTAFARADIGEQTQKALEK